MRSLLLVCSVAMAAVVGVQGFLGGVRLPSAAINTRKWNVLGANIGQNVVSTREGKAARITQYKEWLESADLIFAIPSFNLTVKDVSVLRKKMPEGVQVHIAKNTLLRRAAEGSGFACVSDKLEGANLWFFLKEDNIKETFKAYKAYMKELKKDSSHLYKFGVFESKFLDVAGIDAVSELPSKVEIYARLINVLREPPQQLASILQMGGGNLLQVLTAINENKEKEKPEEASAPA